MERSEAVGGPVRWDWLKVERTRVPMGKGGEVEEVDVVDVDVDVDVVDVDGPSEMTVPSMSEQGTRAGEAPEVIVA